MLEVTTLDTRTTEAGLTLKLRKRLVACEHPVYLVTDKNGLLFEGTYSEAVSYMDWWLDGCPV